MKKKLLKMFSVILSMCLVVGVFTGCDEDWEDWEEDTRETSSMHVNPLNAEIKPLFESGAVREPQVKLKGDGTDTVTILVYMNGSNLETDDTEATTDLSEIVAAGSSDKVNILVQTMGTKKWSSKYGIASNRSQIYKVNGNGLTLLKDDLGQLDCTASESLSDFIMWGVQNYPADRYILHFWDHGGGPVYGFGYDEWNDDEYAALTIDEMQNALKKAGVYFDFVGMDCCLMSCLEVCCAFYDYCDYMILSEDFESGLGWAYTNWVKQLYANPSISTPELGKIICDDMVRANETEEGGDKSSMTVVNQGMLKVLYTAWTDFAFANEKELTSKNYSRTMKRRVGGRILPRIMNRPFGWNYDFFGSDEYEDEEEATMAQYYVTDIMEVAKTIGSEQADALSAAINETLLYVKNTESDAGLTGIAVSLPYGDSDYYASMKPIFLNIGLDSTYVDWLSKFITVQGNNQSNHDDWDDSWEGWDQYEDDFDWNDWDYSDDEECWTEDGYGWNDWGYENSWNHWADESHWEPGHGGYDDWYYGNDYRYDDDWYGDGDWDDDYYDDEDDGWWFW